MNIINHEQSLLTALCQVKHPFATLRSCDSYDPLRLGLLLPEASLKLGHLSRSKLPQGRVHSSHSHHGSGLASVSTKRTLLKVWPVIHVVSQMYLNQSIYFHNVYISSIFDYVICIERERVKERERERISYTVQVVPWRAGGGSFRAKTLCG